jgi:mannose-6-phosphate isomerase-like protein (cupin superfamily)
MAGKELFYENIEKKTAENKYYRHVLYTGKSMQIVVMNIPPNDDIHNEKHETIDQFIRIEKGVGKAIIDSKTYDLNEGIGLIIPASKWHQIINTSSTDDLKLYTIYSPPEHEDGKKQLVNPDKVKEGGNDFYNKYKKYKSKYKNLLKNLKIIIN